MPKTAKPSGPVKNPTGTSKIERENVAEKAKNRDKDRRPMTDSKISKGSRRRAR